MEVSISSHTQYYHCDVSKITSVDNITDYLRIICVSMIHLQYYMLKCLLIPLIFM